MEPQEEALRDAVMAYYAAVDADRIDELLSVFSDDVVYHRPGYEPLCGRAEMHAFHSGARVISSGEHVIDEVVVNGDRVAVRGHFTGVLRDGSPRWVGFADFYRFGTDGRATERRTYFDMPAV